MTTTQDLPATADETPSAAETPSPDGRVMSGADIVLESLKRAGTTTVFGYPGGVVLPLYDRLPAHPGVRHILVRHEQGGGHAADAADARGSRDQPHGDGPARGRAGP